MGIFDDVGGHFLFIWAQIVLQLSNLHESVTAIIAEMVDNSHDAGASEVLVILEPARIVVSDNGQGMNPFILPEDAETLKLHWEDFENKKVDPDFDIRTLISEPSKKSLEWMVLNVAFSGKTPQPGEKVRGTRGIGIQGARQLAEHCEWISKPSPEIVPNYEGKIADVSIPVYHVVLPSEDDLRRGNVDPRIEPTGETDVVDPIGSQQLHGTTVILSRLKPNVQHSLRPNALVEYLHARFGADIKDGLRLVVIDRISEEGRRHPSGVSTMVPPPSYIGYPVLNEWLSIKGGRASFEVDLWYDPNGKDHRIMLRRKGTDVAPINSLEEFNQGIFLSGKINGHIEYVDLPETEAPWNTAKTAPLDTPIRNHWQRAVWQKVPDAETNIAEIDSRAREEQLSQASKTIAKATLEAMRELDLFRDVVVGTVEQPPKKPRSRGESSVEERVVVTVFDEHNRGVAGVTIELLTHNDLLANRQTGLSGQVSFGRREYGRYRVRMVIPEGMKPADDVGEYTFNLGSNQPGIRAIFRVTTGLPKLEVKKVGNLIISYLPLSDPSQAYSSEHFPRFGLVQINTEHVGYRYAHSNSDHEMINVLTAQYCSAAVSEYGLSEFSAAEQLQGASVLFSRTLTHLRSQRRSRK